MVLVLTFLVSSLRFLGPFTEAWYLFFAWFLQKPDINYLVEFQNKYKFLVVLHTLTWWSHEQTSRDGILLAVSIPEIGFTPLLWGIRWCILYGLLQVGLFCLMSSGNCMVGASVSYLSAPEFYFLCSKNVTKWRWRTHHAAIQCRHHSVVELVHSLLTLANFGVLLRQSNHHTGLGDNGFGQICYMRCSYTFWWNEQTW